MQSFRVFCLTFVLLGLVAVSCFADDHNAVEILDDDVPEKEQQQSAPDDDDLSATEAETDGDFDILEKRFSSGALVDNLRHVLKASGKAKRFSSPALFDNLRHVIKASSGQTNKRSFSSGALVDNLRHVLNSNRGKRFSSGALVDNLRHMIKASSPSAGGAVARNKRFSSPILIDNLRQALAAGIHVQQRSPRPEQWRHFVLINV